MVIRSQDDKRHKDILILLKTRLTRREHVSVPPPPLTPVWTQYGLCNAAPAVGCGTVRYKHTGEAPEHLVLTYIQMDAGRDAAVCRLPSDSNGPTQFS